jgi:poly-gamma-glutamate capsule biosynthesis protein CapA/YwtB (metallophosphatase superfamily)
MPKDRLSLLAAGDLVPTRRLFPAGKPATPEFAKVAELVAAADIAVCNVDAPLTSGGYPKEKLIALRVSPELAPDIRQLGFEVVSVANNHGMDYGEIGLFDTLTAYDQAGVQHVGGGVDLQSATAPVVVEVDGWTVGILGWTCLLPTGAAASPERPGQAPLHVHASYEVNPYLVMEEPTTAPTVRTRVDEADLEAATASIADLRLRVDFLVALVHWGAGLSDEIAEYQRPLGRTLLDAGADVVVGSHPHRVLGIEKHGQKVIFYSPGTLVEQLPREGVDPATLAVYEALSPDSFIASLDISPDGGYAVRLTPTTLGAQGVPVIATGEAFDRIAERVVRMSSALGTAIEVGDGQLSVSS